MYVIMYVDEKKPTLIMKNKQTKAFDNILRTLMKISHFLPILTST